MNFKPKIKSLFTNVVLMALAIITALSLNTIQAHATNAPSASEAASAIFTDIQGVSGGSGGNSTVPDVISADRTGYICYLLTADGNTVGEAYAFKSPNFTELNGVAWMAQSRKGHTVTGFEATAPWGLPPFNRDKSTNQAAIREWMEGTTGGVMNATDFVNSYWGKGTVAKKFLAGEYVLVVETFLHFQFSFPSENATAPPNANSIDIEAYVKKKFGLGDSWKPSAEYLSSVRNMLNEMLKEEWEKNGGSTQGYTKVGSPVVGTDKDCLAYYQAVVASQGPNWFKSYLNKIVPFAEFIRAGGPGEQAKFTPWTGSQISNSDVDTYGVAMFVVKAKNDAINTYSPPAGSPGPAEDPSTNPSKQGNVTIVKGYYTENETTGEKVSDGVYTQPNTTNKINIMDEPEYQLVRWDITTSDPTEPDPAGSWITGSPSGTAPTTVELKENEKTLYVLLKKIEVEEIEESDISWILNESEITKSVQSGDKTNTEPLTVTLPNLESCNGHTGITTSETEISCSQYYSNKVADGDSSAKPCDSSCTGGHTVTTTSTYNYSCESWTPNDKQFSLTSRNILFRNQVKKQTMKPW